MTASPARRRKTEQPPKSAWSILLARDRRERPGSHFAPSRPRAGRSARRDVKLERVSSRRERVRLGSFFVAAMTRASV